MKLTKNLLAIAVAGAMVAPAAMADVEVYGKAHVSAGMLDNDGTDGDSLYMLPNNSNVGVRGTEDLGNGLKALYQMEMGIDWSGGSGVDLRANNDALLRGSSSHTLRDTYVGFGGGWGTFLAGRVNSPYKMATNNLDPFADTVGDFNAIMGVSPNGTQHDNRISNSLSYKSNNINGFELGATYGMNDGADLNAARERGVYALAASYKTGPIYVAGAYQNATEFGPSTGGSNEDDEAMKVGASWSFAEDNGTIAGVWETIDGGGSNNDRDAIYLSGTWKMGATKLGLGVGMADDIGSASNTDATHFTGGVYHSLSKATQVYALYTQLDAGSGLADDTDGDGTVEAGEYGGGYSLGGFGPRNEATGSDFSAMGFFLGVIHNFSSK